MAVLVGRDRELAALAAWLDGALAGTGAVALVSGEPGIGKSRFLEEASARATDRGFAVAWGRAWEVSSAPPYWPWIEALRALFARPGGRDAAAAQLCRLLPELDRSAGSDTAAPADPFPLYDAVVAYLQGVSAREPFVIVLDDLHAADPSSLRLAELVAPQLRRMRAALLGSFRDVEARLAPATESALVRLGRRGETLQLGRLDVDGVRVLVRDATGRDDREVARMIHEASEGNPLFVRELLKLIAARGAGSGDVPAGVRSVIRERLGLLAPATVALLSAAAVVGRTFGIALAAEVAGVTAGALEEAIGDASAAEVVVPAEPGRYRFSHALVAETLAAELAAPVRARLHRRTAEILERDHAGDPAAPFAEITHHWLAAGAEAAGAALAAAERAAAAAEARVAFADAAELYDRAIGALAIVAPGDARRRADFLIRQGHALVRGGERPRALGPCTAAAELARTLGDGVLFARAALAYGADVAVAQIDVRLVELLERALDLLPAGDDPWRAKVMGRLAAARQPATDAREPIALAHEAIAMARRLGDPAVLADVMFSATGALTDFERPERRAPINAEVARIAARSGDLPRQLRSLQRLAFDQIDLGEVAAFEDTVREYETLAAPTGQARYRWVPILFRAMRAGWEGRWADEERLLDEGFEIRERLGEPVGALRLVRRMMRWPAADAVEFDTVAAVAAAGHVDFLHLIRGWAHACHGRLADAARELDWLVSRGYARSYFLIHGARMLSQLLWTLRHRDGAALVYDRLDEERGRPFMVTSMGFQITGAADHERMRLAAVLGRWDDVERHAEEGLALYGRLGAVPFAAELRADHAEALVDRGDTEALVRARALIADVEPVAAALALEGVAATCARVAARLGGALPPPAAGVPPPAVAPPAAASAGRAPIAMTREGEYWTVAGLGELCRIKDSRGMQMLARLIDHPGQDVHVIDLVGAEGVDAGDAGEVLDRDTRVAYQARLRELREELEEAEAWNDAGRRARLEHEIDALTSELTSAYGLGGRERRTGAAVERARQNARRRIADAMQRIAAACPALGRHLELAVRTGASCTYDPGRAIG